MHEWHPRQGETDDAVLRTVAMNEIQKMYANKCRLVQPFSWTGSATYPVKDSGIAVGLKEWMDAKLVTQTPTITAFTNQSVNMNTPTAALPFSVADDVIPAGSVLVTAASSNTTLVPNANIVITGTGANRSVTATPASSQGGTTTITLTASDGLLTSTSSFVVTVNSNQAPTITSISDQTVLENTVTSALAFTIGDDSTPVGSLTVTRSSSNTTLAPTANLVLGGSGASRTITVTPASNQTGTSTITLLVSDGSLTTSTNFTLTVLPAGSIIGTLYSDLADSAPRQVDGSGPSILTSTASDATLYAGRSGAGGTVDRCVVFPFQLPQLGNAATPFTSATLAFDLVSNNFSPTVCNLDLYGLGVRDAPTVLATDFYSETDTPDPTAGTSRLQDNLCTMNTPAGPISSSGGGNTALVNYLNAQYAGGANAGKFVFLRLSKDTANGTNTKQYVVTAADGASAASDTSIWPRINYNAVPGNSAPTISDIADRSIAVNTNTGAIPFTIGDGQTDPASLTLSKASSNPTLVPAANIVFGGSGANRTVTVTPAANQLGSTIVTVTVSDGSLTTSDTFLVTVTGTASETWRFTHFGTTANSGMAADAFDSNNDGENNLLEFATGQNPHANTRAETTAALNGSDLEFRYTRSKAALAAGVTFTVQWSDTLAPNSWSSLGVTDILDPDNPGTDEVENRIATLPGGTNGKRFVWLEVARP